VERVFSAARPRLGNMRTIENKEKRIQRCIIRNAFPYFKECSAQMFSGNSSPTNNSLFTISNVIGWMVSSCDCFTGLSIALLD
jgi:hypothetical protein